MLDALAGGVADLQSHHGAGNTADDLPRHATGLRTALDGDRALARDFGQGTFHAGGKVAEGIGVNVLELAALAGGLIDLAGQLPINGGEILDGGAGAFG